MNTNKTSKNNIKNSNNSLENKTIHIVDERDLNIEIQQKANKLQKLLASKKRKSFEKRLIYKYNLKLTEKLDPYMLISEIIASIYLLKDNYHLQPNLFRFLHVQGINGLGKDVIKGTQLNQIDDSIGYYSCLYFIYRFITIILGRCVVFLLKNPDKQSEDFFYNKALFSSDDFFNSYDLKSLSVIKNAIANKQRSLSESNKPIKIIDFFYTVISELDQTNNSPTISISSLNLKHSNDKSSIYRRFTHHPDLLCWIYLHFVGNESNRDGSPHISGPGWDEPLIKTMGISDYETFFYRSLSTTSIMSLYNLCKKLENDNVSESDSDLNNGSTENHKSISQDTKILISDIYNKFSISPKKSYKNIKKTHTKRLRSPNNSELAKKTQKVSGSKSKSKSKSKPKSKSKSKILSISTSRTESLSKSIRRYNSKSKRRAESKRKIS